MPKRKHSFNLSRLELLILSIIVLLSSCLLVEFSIPLLYRVLQGEPFPKNALRQSLFYLSQQTQASLQSPPQSPRPDGQGFEAFDKRVYVIHPYVGYVENQTGRERAAYRYLGWPDEMLTRAEGKLIVGIFGGSVAKGLYTDAGDVLSARLQALTGKEVSLVRIAEGGYKQPQLALALTYLLSQGAQFDLIINLDGFNEVALPILENVEKGVYPMYPRNWYFLLGQVSNPDTLAVMGQLEALARQQYSWAQYFAGKGLYRSNIFLTIWWARETQMEQDYSALQLKLLRSRGNTEPSGFGVTGPLVDYPDEDAIYQELGRTWQQSSLQMHALSQGNGAQYFHFLQPNQYVPNSKTFGTDEMNIAILPSHPFRDGVEKGYPYLIQYGQEMTAQGVHFHDLTMIFAQESQLLYIDACCHYSQAGYQLLAERIVELMVQDGFTGQ